MVVVDTAIYLQLGCFAHLLVSAHTCLIFLDVQLMEGQQGFGNIVCGMSGLARDTERGAGWCATACVVRPCVHVLASVVLRVCLARLVLSACVACLLVVVAQY